MISLIFLLGVCAGFLVKHELDARAKSKRMKKKRDHSIPSTEKSNETLRCVRELNENLSMVQKKTARTK